MDLSAIIVLGSINVDLVVRAPRLPGPGETVCGTDFSQIRGGKGANQAVAAARAQSQPVIFLAAVGDDAFGRWSVEGLQKENLRLDWIKTVGDTPTGIALITVASGGENAITVASGANDFLTPEDIDAVPAEVFASARVMLACLESPLPTIWRGLERAKANGLTTILNPAPAEPLVNNLDLLKLVDVITPNRTEAAILTGAQMGHEASAVESARRLQALGCAQCIVTLGSEGCIVVAKEVTSIDAHRIAAVDGTAAGDAFNGALAVALSEGQPLERAARWANAAAAVSVTRHGAQPSLPTRREIENMLMSQKIQ